MAWNSLISECYQKIMPDHILLQPLWNNPLFRDKSYLLQRWFDAGLRCLGDILHVQGRFKTFEELKMEFQINGHFLEYSKLVNIIPSEWKSQLRNNGIYTNQDSYVPPIKRFLLDKKTRVAHKYYKMVCSTGIEPTAQKTWQRKLGVEGLPWDRYYILPFITTQEARLRDLQYKILHRIVAVNETLFRMKLSQTDMCSFCGDEVESIEHLFVDCEFSEQLWDQVNVMLSNRTGKEINLSKLEKLFGIIRENDAINHIIMLVKKHIYYKKMTNSKPNIVDYIIYMKGIISVEHYIAKLQGKEEKCTEKWSTFRQD